MTDEFLEDYVDDDQLATAFNRSKRTIQRWRRLGKLPPTTDPGNLTSTKKLRKQLEVEAA